MPSLVRFLAGVSCVYATSGIALANKNDLPDRDTPVPANQPIPIIDFARPNLFEDPILNPSGTYFAAFTKNERLENSLLTCELGTNKVKWSNSGVTNFAWIDDRHLLLNDKDHGVVDVNNPRRQDLTSSLLPMGERGLMHETGFLWKWPLTEIPTVSGRVRGVWHSRENGRPAYCELIQEDSHRYLYRREGQNWVKCPVDLDEITPVTIGSQPGEMIVVGPAAKGSPRALQRLDTFTGRLGEVLYRDPEYDCTSSVFLKRDTLQAIGVSVPGKYPRTVWFDERMKEVQGMIDRQFPTTIAEIVSTDLKQNRFVIRTESDREPAVFNLLDYGKKSLSLIKRVEPWLDPARLARMQVVSYKARDGAAIDAYLLLPPGITKEKPAPLVVLIHGGPWSSRANWGVNETAQYFVSRGFAALIPNYRGSLGYDSRFDPDDRYNFQKMSNDVSDGVHALLGSGLIDPQRIVAHGIGFGAYLALCGVVDEPELYRCAILHGGMFDWEKQFRKIDSPTRFEDAWIERRLREAKATPPAPMRQTDRIKIPLFFTRNATIPDTTYDTQIFELYLAMKAKVPCEFFGDLNIYTWNEAYIDAVERTTLIEAFLTKYLAPQGSNPRIQAKN